MVDVPCRAAAATIITVRHDHTVQANRAAKHAAQVAAAAKQAAAAEARAAAEAKKEKDRAERAVRHELVGEMQASITKDARKDVTNGLLDGPILSTTCNPLGGGSSDDLTALTTTFECIAVTKKNPDGTESGYRFAATANWNDSSYTWRLGS